MGPTLTFRTTFARGLMIGIAIIATVVTVHGAWFGGVDGVLDSLPLTLGAACVTWLLFGNPKVEVSDGGVTVVNILRRAHVPWPTLQAVTTKWSLTVEYTGGMVRSWAIPAPSGMGSRARSLRSHRRTGAAGPGGAGEEAVTSGNDAVAVALAIGERRETLVAEGFLSAEPTLGEVSAQRGWNVREVAVLAATVAAISIAQTVL